VKTKRKSKWKNLRKNVISVGHLRKKSPIFGGFKVDLGVFSHMKTSITPLKKIPTNFIDLYKMGENSKTFGIVESLSLSEEHAMKFPSLLAQKDSKMISHILPK